MPHHFPAMPQLRILPLGECPHVMEQLAQWHYAEWGSWNPSNNVHRRMERFRDHLVPDRIPQTFVAFEGDTLLGSASIVPADLDSHFHLSPWLASVYVNPPYRHRGVGAALVNRAADEAKRLGLPKLYLFTPDRAAFYTRLGWEVIEQSNWGAMPVTIMQLDFTPA